MSDFINCDLCILERRENTIYEDKYFIVCDCDKHKFSMIVLKRHDTNLIQEEMIDLMFMLNKLDLKQVKEINQGKNTIKDHWHAHLTPFWWTEKREEKLRWKN